MGLPTPIRVLARLGKISGWKAPPRGDRLGLLGGEHPISATLVVSTHGGVRLPTDHRVD